MVGLFVVLIVSKISGIGLVHQATVFNLRLHRLRGPGPKFSCTLSFSLIRGDEFKLHVKCISEAEKYNGPDWKPSSSQNKGERKQVAWIETVNAVLDKGKQNMTPGQIALLKAISKHDNVPRKKAKFLVCASPQQHDTSFFNQFN